MINYIAGLPVHVLDDTHLIVEPGSVALWHGSGWAIDTVSYTDIITIDMNTAGLNGRDAGSLSSGCYYIYALYNPSTGAKGFVASRAISFNDVAFPAGFTSWRKLMYGQPVVNGRCLPVHASHWPQPEVLFTDLDPTFSFTIATKGSWIPLNLANYIPENSRMGIFAGRIAGGTGSLWISPVSNVPNPYFKTVLENQAGLSGDVRCRIDGAQTVYVWADGGGVAQLILRGFDMTEVS